MCIMKENASSQFKFSLPQSPALLPGESFSKPEQKQMKGSVKEPNMFHNYETEKITRKASDAA